MLHHGPDRLGRGSRESDVMRVARRCALRSLGLITPGVYPCVAFLAFGGRRRRLDLTRHRRQHLSGDVDLFAHLVPVALLDRLTNSR